jgi:hypothetical protein
MADVRLSDQRRRSSAAAARAGDEAEDDSPLIEIPPARLPVGSELSAAESATARAVFDSYCLPPARVKELRLAPPTAEVMETEMLRLALAEMGYVVGGAELFGLVSAADANAIGVVERETWMAVIRLRKRLAADAERQAESLRAYVALGGTVGKTDKVALKPLLDIFQAFGVAADLGRANEAIVSRRMKLVEEVLAMGGELEEDELDELKSTERVDFDDLNAFAGALGGAS